MKEVALPDSGQSLDTVSFLACLATVLELPFERMPAPGSSEDPARGWTVSRWLGGLGLGLARIADPAAFSWAGPWIARGRMPGDDARRSVVMYGVPSGVLWDPSGTAHDDFVIEEGFLIAAADIAQALPAQATAPIADGTVESIWIAPAASEPAVALNAARAIAGWGLDGDRHVNGTGTFPSNLPGSALTLIEAEVCESFDPPLAPDEHRRNIVTRGIDLNGLVGREFMIGDLRCRGMRLCEPCRVIQHYAERPILRPLVHRGGLRADILADGEISLGVAVRVIG